ncbi:MAG TPA: hypothetical protein VFR90_16785 [Methylibium sp.]|uniref:serine/threonine protein kinase n=1 Tax=Methylibium sp. TaxID=2067992 RepID=UPI002DBED52C|nr:hypothetical protein [Methylibium sp.]HEU4460778.1 hypothetical protein [Methylibium sp.]
MNAPVSIHPPLDALEPREAPALPASVKPRAPRRAVADSAAPGSAVGSFVLGEVVEHDDFRLCYRARATASESDVLIDEYWPKALVQRGADGEATLREANFAELYDAGLRAFIAESEALAQIEHRALVRIGPMWPLRSTAYRLRVDAATHRLSHHLEGRPRPIDEQWLRALAEPLLGALDAVHRAGRIHGNVRPGAIALRGDAKDGEPLLLDCDAARNAIASLAPWRAVSPEPGYAAPELALYGVEATPAADLFSLAAVLWFASTGELPEATSTGHGGSLSRWEGVLQRHPSLRYSAGWMAALERALAFDPSVRPQDAEAFRRLLATAPAAPSVLEAVRQAPAMPAARIEPPPMQDEAAWSLPMPSAASDPAQEPWPTSRAASGAIEPGWPLLAPHAAEQAARTGQAEQAARPGQAEQATRPGQTEQATRPDQAEKAGRLGQAEQAARPSRAGRIARSSQVERAAARLARADSAARMSRPARAEPAAWPSQAEPAARFSHAEPAMRSSRPVPLDPPPMRAADPDSEPPWQLPSFAVGDAQRVEPEPWPVSRRASVHGPFYDGPAEGSRAGDIPWGRRAPTPKPKRHWPWAVGGGLVGGMAMLVFGLANERSLDALPFAQWFGQTPPAVAGSVGLLPPANPGIAAMQAPPAAGPPGPQGAAAGAATPVGQAASPYPLPPAGAGPEAAPPLTGGESGKAVLPTSARADAAQRAGAAGSQAPRAEVAVGGDATRAGVIVGNDAPRSRVDDSDAARALEARREAASGSLDPAAVCAPRSNFALYWCMKTQCDRTVNYTHPQCVALRREDQR